MMKYKIIIDSSCDLSPDYLKGTGIELAIVPFTVSVGDKSFLDTPELDTLELLSSIEAFNGKPLSACPSPQSFLEQMTGADKYIIITISSKLSGSFNAGIVAKNSFSSPNDVFVVDSKTVTGGMILIVDKLVGLISDQLPFINICESITEYINKNLELFFTLKDYSNLVKNGRMTPLQAMIASTLRIKPVCVACDGEIKIAKKLLGSKRLIREIVQMVEQKKEKYSFAKCIISHADNIGDAKILQDELNAKNLFGKIEIIAMRGLCSFYAMRKGLIVSFEK